MKPIKTSFIILFLTKVESLWSLIILINNAVQNKGVIGDADITKWQYWVFHITTSIAVFLVVFYFLSKVQEIKEELIITNLIGRVRNRNLFLKQFNSNDYFLLPNETEADFLASLPQGQPYKDYVQHEYKLVKQLLFKKFKNKKTEEIEKILKAVYK
jgi:hypothetical protein